VALGDAVDPAAQGQRQAGHVQPVRPGQAAQLRRVRHVAQVRQRLGVVERVVAGRHRRVGREHAQPLDRGHAAVGVAGMPAQQLQREEGRVALVQVVLVDGDAKGL
jgi:hypothetical protein